MIRICKSLATLSLALEVDSWPGDRSENSVRRCDVAVPYTWLYPVGRQDACVVRASKNPCWKEAGAGGVLSAQQRAALPGREAWTDWECVLGHTPEFQVCHLQKKVTMRGEHVGNS